MAETYPLLDISYATYNHIRRIPPNINIDDWRIVDTNSAFPHLHPHAPWVVRRHGRVVGVAWDKEKIHSAPGVLRHDKTNPK